MLHEPSYYTKADEDVTIDAMEVVKYAETHVMLVSGAWDFYPRRYTLLSARLNSDGYMILVAAHRYYSTEKMSLAPGTMITLAPKSENDLHFEEDLKRYVTKGKDDSVEVFLPTR